MEAFWLIFAYQLIASPKVITMQKLLGALASNGKLVLKQHQHSPTSRDVPAVPPVSMEVPYVSIAVGGGEHKS